MIGSVEFIVVVIAALIFFGPDKLLDFSQSVINAIGDFKKALHEAESNGNGLYESNTNRNMPEIKEKIKKLAEEMGINSEGKDSEEIIDMLTDIIKEKDFQIKD